MGGIGDEAFAMKAAAVVSVVVSIAWAERFQVQAMRACRSSRSKKRSDCFQQSTTIKMSSAPMPRMTKIPRGQRVLKRSYPKGPM